jgi:hypothetical protein
MAKESKQVVKRKYAPKKSTKRNKRKSKSVLPEFVGYTYGKGRK